MADSKKKTKNIFQTVLDWFKDAAEWVQENLGDPEIAKALREDLALKPGGNVSSADQEKFRQFTDGLDTDKAAFEETVAELVAAIPLFRALGEQLKTDSLDAADVAFLVGRLAAVDSLRVRQPLIYSIAKILTLITDDPDSVEAFDLDMLTRIVRDWNLDAFRSDFGRRVALQLTPSAILAVLDILLEEKANVDPDKIEYYYGWDPAPGTPTPIADFVAGRAGTIRLRLPPDDVTGLNLTFIQVAPAHGGSGLFLALTGSADFQHKRERLFVSFKTEQTTAEIESFTKKYSLELDETFTRQSFSFDLISGTSKPLAELVTKIQTDEPSVDAIDSEAFEAKIAAVIPGQLNFFMPMEKSAQDAKFFVDLGSPYLKASFLLGSDQSPALRIGEKDKTRIDIPKMLFEAEFSPEKALIRWGFQGGKLVVNLGSDGDAFVSNIGGKQVQAGMDFALIADSEGGLRVDGGAGFKATIPGGELFGGAFTIHHIDLELGPGANNRDLGLEISGAFAFNLGPFQGSVDRLGFLLNADFGAGNLGWLDLALGFKFPNGIGLVLDAAVVKGGGYLFIDQQRGEYAGAFELTIAAISVKAIVVLSTKMPDGSDGWSLLLLIYTQFPPIQLSWGFTLNGVGGMIGVQHGMQIEELKSGMRTGALDDILFPKNPVADAPRIISRLRVIFPATARALVVGPMLELGWSTPTIIKIRMGLLFQLDNVFGGDQPVSIKRIILLGQLVIQLPPEVDDKLVVLKLLVDFYGYYDFDINRLEFAARLRDSHVIKLPLSGMLFVRAEFGDKPTFILSAGGFHPNFKDLPADIPSPIDRLGINFNIGIVKVQAQMYFAITPASVQTGAGIDVQAKVGPVAITGWLGYDAIFYFQPRFYFEVDIRAGVAVKFKGHSLASVTLKMHLEGPGRWRARGQVSFSILWWDIEKSFDESWGTDPELAPVSTNVSALMQQALSDEGNWRAQLPQGGESVVTLAIADGATGVLAHPLGQLQVSQKVAPFDLELQRFGNAQVQGPNKFEIKELRVAGHLIDLDHREQALEFFARSHFVDMSDDDKLTAPSFEKFSSGVLVGSDEYQAAPEVIPADLDFETAYLDRENPVPRIVRPLTKVGLGITRDMILTQAAHGAAAKSALRRNQTLRPATSRKIRLKEAGIQVADADTRASAVSLQGLAKTTSALAEQQARNSLGKDALGATHVMIEDFEFEQ